eukprot:scaffold5896_cov54-Phaeocystis_antarctica.AAC.4
MQLHIEELMRQTELRERELQKTQAQLKEHAKQRAVHQPQERKLFTYRQPWDLDPGPEAISSRDP